MDFESHRNFKKSSHDKLLRISDWLLDSGVSCHMSSDLSLLTDISELMPIPVDLANGIMMLAHKRGSVKLSSKITLRDVLYVPSLKCNLMSISQLVDEIFYIVTFSYKS